MAGNDLKQEQPPSDGKSGDQPVGEGAGVAAATPRRATLAWQWASPPALAPHLASFLSRIKKWLQWLIGAILSAAVLSWVSGFVAGPDNYRVYVVGNNSDALIKEMIDLIHQKVLDGNLTIDGKKIIAEIRDDYGSPEQAHREAADIAARSDALLVVGHFYSSSTKMALPTYLDRPSPIPLIMVTETNPELRPPIRNSDNGLEYPMLRLWPTDKAQARDLADYAASRDVGTFWMVEDQWTNASYSHYLAENIIQHLQDKKQRVLLWSTNQSVPSVETLRRLGIRGIIFPGLWSNALLLLQQVRAIWPNSDTPQVFLTDFSFNDRLLKSGGAALEGVYVTHPMEACEYSVDGYHRLAEDAVEIIRRILAQANADFASSNPYHRFKQAFKYHDVRDARVAFAKALAKRRSFVAMPSGENYAFDKYGERQEGRFHLWQVKNGTFVRVDGEPCSH